MLRPTSPRRLHRLRDGGFTLIELIGVLAMISLLVVMASPTFVRVMRDRRVARAAMQLVDYYRTARTAAIGRGQPMLVAYNASGNAATHPGGTGRITMMEPIVTTMQAATTCNTTIWGDTTKAMTRMVRLAATTREVDSFARAPGSWVIAAASEPYGMFTKL